MNPWMALLYAVVVVIVALFLWEVVENLKSKRIEQKLYNAQVEKEIEKTKEETLKSRRRVEQYQSEQERN